MTLWEQESETQTLTNEQITPEVKRVTVFTDGACIGNPGPGGYGVVLVYGDHRRELSEGFVRTTNNRMEILAAIVALKALKERCHVTIYSDSTYVVNGIEQGWAERWRTKGWKLKDKGRALNTDLWQRLLDLCGEHEVEFKWTRGHAGHTENERCDRLATDAARNSAISVDEVYESTKFGETT